MTQREKLIELLSQKIYPKEGVDHAEVVADYLLDNGVTVRTEPLTNADHIRSMTDEDLAEFLLLCGGGNFVVGLCNEENCAECTEVLARCSGNCKDAALKWLNRPKIGSW